MLTPTWPWKIRAVQLDLARQTETVEFICRYADFAAAHGYNTLLLYLEGRIRTPSFPHRPAAASYTADDMRRVVEHCQRIGLDVVPAVSVLGHAEQFVMCEEMKHLAEERDGASRWGGNGRSTFCPSLPELRAFLEAYLAEIAAIFPGPHLHVGYDEDWNVGFCELCQPRWKKDGLGRLFTEHLLWAHDLAQRLGKRTWIWDDMFEFWPEELERLPRDIVMCHWNYDAVVHAEGSQAHFRNRYRHDWLGLYARLGFDAIVCPAVGHPSNVLTLTEYARRHPVLGGLLTQWEMSSSFHGGLAPRVAAVGALWGLPVYAPERVVADGIRAVLPGADEGTVAIMEALLRADGGPLRTSVQSYLLGPLTHGEQAQRDLLRTGLALLGGACLGTDARGGACPPGQAVTPPPLSPAGILEDLEVSARLGLVGWALREAVPAIVDPRRTPDRTARLRTVVEDCRRELNTLAPVRARQHTAWRPGCHPVNQGAEGLEKASRFMDELLARLAAEPAADEWWVVLRLCLPDVHGSPRLKLTGMFGAEERQLALGGFKPPMDAEGSHFTVEVPFRSATPPEALRFEFSGYAGQGLAYVEVQSRDRVLIPQRVRGTTGHVHNAQAVLRDDALFAWCGYDDMQTALLDPALARAVAMLEIEIG